MLRKRSHEVLAVNERAKSAMTGVEEDDNLRMLSETQSQVCAFISVVEMFLDEMEGEDGSKNIDGKEMAGGCWVVAGNRMRDTHEDGDDEVEDV